MPEQDEHNDTYDWCWQCCAYHRNLAKECPRQRPFRGEYGSAEDRNERNTEHVDGVVS